MRVRLFLFLAVLAFLAPVGKAGADSALGGDVHYRLYKTTNIYNFIQLDTVTGKMWQIQYAIDNGHRGAMVINGEDLAKGKKATVGRFALVPTENIWTFILIDQIDGGTWQVQWSIEDGKRFVMPIMKVK